MEETLDRTHSVAHGDVWQVHAGEKLELTLTRPQSDPVTLELGSVLRCTAEEDGAVATTEICLGNGSAIEGVHEKEVREKYWATSGKKRGWRSVFHTETTLHLREDNGYTWKLLIRSADDGIAFRYVLPETEGKSFLLKECTRVLPDLNAHICTLPYTTWYETPRIWSLLSLLDQGEYGFPTLIELRKHTNLQSSDPFRYLLLTESDIDETNCGAHITWDGKTIQLTLADAETPICGEYTSPWRVIYMGTLKEIVESTFVDDLARAWKQVDGNPLPEEYVRPGIAAWSWWSSQYSGAYLDTQKHFVDFAWEQGWQHVLVDCGWEGAWIPELVEYASARGINVHLWSAWDDLDGEENLRKLALWKSWGVAGIKVDFMESESRERYLWYKAILDESARVGLMVNFHGSVIPRGWARTYPQVIGYEGIRGAEYYVFYGEPLSSAHNVMQLFTRNVVGAMDYTPVTFSAPQRETSDAHELALAVAFECGITHLADSPDSYKQRPEAVRYLATLPEYWEEICFLGGTPDSYALQARRHGENWWISCLNTGHSKEITLNLDELLSESAGALSQHGEYFVWLVRDCDKKLCADMYRASELPQSIRVEENGGFAAILAPENILNNLLEQRDKRRTIDRLPIASPALGVMRDGVLRVTCDEDAELLLPEGWTSRYLGDASYEISCGEDEVNGNLTVISVARQGTHGQHVLSHIKVVHPYVADTYLNTCFFENCRNALGPVERTCANGGEDPRDGAPMTIQGYTYDNGLGVSQESSIRIALDGQKMLLRGCVGIDDETPESNANASIWIDGKEIWRTHLQGSEDPREFLLPIGEGRILELRTESCGEEAHVDWISPQLVLAR